MSIPVRMMLVALAGCSVWLMQAAIVPLLADEHEAGGPHWSYDGETGPDRWAALSPAFKACGLGRAQTPINLSLADTGNPDPVAVDYHLSPVSVVNNGHTIQADVASGNSVSIRGVRYDLAQFHFHHPSEHVVDGKPFDMEVHFVHKSAAGGIAVLGSLINTGAHNPALQTILDEMPRTAQDGARSVATFDPATLMPAGHAFYRYSGSLTTPPCTEGLVWTVFRDPIEASPDQIAAFKVLFPNNARPIQHRNGRLLIEASGS